MFFGGFYSHWVLKRNMLCKCISNILVLVWPEVAQWLAPGLRCGGGGGGFYYVDSTLWRRFLPTTGRSHLSEVLQGIFIIITYFIFLIISFDHHDHHHDHCLQLLPHQHLVDVVLPLRAPSSQGSFLSNTLTGSPGSNIQHKGRRSHFHLERLMTKILFSQ